MIKEITCEKAIDYEGQPDGGKVPVLDAYDGCQLCCLMLSMAGSDLETRTSW